MSIMHHLKLARLYFLLFLGIIESSATNTIANLQVSTKIDLKTNFVLVKNAVLFENNGPKPVSSYTYAVNTPGLYSIYFYDVQEVKLHYKKLDSSNFQVFLNQVVQNNDTFLLLCKMNFAEKIAPVTKYRRMVEDQLVKFTGDLRFFSAYPTHFCKVEYILKDELIVDMTHSPTVKTNSSFTFLFYDIPKFDSTQLEIVFVRNECFLVIRNLDRSIDVNHFGKIVIHDKVVLQNNGSRLLGPFNPLLIDNKKSLKSWFYTALPASAEHVQMFDILGYNTQTHIFKVIEFLALKFKSRYPLLGGWKTAYTLRYEVPIYEYLFVRKQSFVLKVRAIDYVLQQGGVIDDAVIRILLPEGALIKNINKPEILHLNRDVDFDGNLVIFGRPTVVLSGRRLFDNYITTVDVEYSLSNWTLLRPALIIIIYLEVVFVVFICSRKYLF